MQNKNKLVVGVAPHFQHDFVVVGVGRDLQVLQMFDWQHVHVVTVLDVVSDQVLSTDYLSQVEEEHDVDHNSQVTRHLLLKQKSRAIKLARTNSNYSSFECVNSWIQGFFLLRIIIH